LLHIDYSVIHMIAWTSSSFRLDAAVSLPVSCHAYG
jgi:hypothetical protein